MDRCSNSGGKSRKKESQQKEDQGARKSRKVAKHSVFPMFCGSRGPKSRLAKAGGAEPSGEIRDKKCTPLWCEANLEKRAKHTMFGAVLEDGCCCAKNISKSKWLKHLVSEQLRCRKVRAAVARRTRRSQKAKSRSGLEHFGS